MAVTECWHRTSDDVPLCHDALISYAIFDSPHLPSPTRLQGSRWWYCHLLSHSPSCLNYLIGHGSYYLWSLFQLWFDNCTVNIYHPGSMYITAKVFEELASVLESIAICDSQLFILSDCNIHLEENTRASTNQFLELLKHVKHVFIHQPSQITHLLISFFCHFTLYLYVLSRWYEAGSHFTTGLSARLFRMWPWEHSHVVTLHWWSLQSLHVSTNQPNAHTSESSHAQ